MNLGQRAVKELSKARSGLLDRGGKVRILSDDLGYIFEDEKDNLRLRIEVEDIDKYSVLLRSIEAHKAQKDDGRKLSISIVEKQAKTLEEKLTYLLENCRTIEVDRNLMTAQIRSELPFKDDAGIHYYEVLLTKGTSLKFSRYAKQSDKLRVEETCLLSDKILARLIDDLVATIRIDVD